MGDAVDLITEAWHRERPDVDVSPMHIIGRITRLSRVLEQDLKRFFAGHGLEFWEFDVLATLRRSGGTEGLTAGALNRAAMVTSGAITNRIDRLAAKGLVERMPCPEDRRSVRVRLTVEGRKLVDELLPLHVANEQRLLDALDTQDRDQLAALLRRLAESLGDTALD
ncbi:DNA-binding transcriptional regulator, MarR family [Nocardia amikacinitolerans]|uniref:DNA-binding transcriptional regulator, MarR family n=1 Tax=Nocardia amikacinitolerans TaxID=756689 RepID=A0A285LQG7_9NOCA|nr:MarR family transcriptional regulator [Nocardia amikacinitolerans]MCP2276858.1 DNA-binding transcriptional regulator, MarR family [Nocardia amikacinitolerans]MCP2294761.1 DNA-binding transcriptional regulator, MarR family [Nocardia amikacinitolerans]SNY87190.1 DNA-binding transcriptional regulator, MarR family [Nocardia amikacinitolerans]